MRRVIRVLLVAVALLVLAGCGSTVKNVIASISASHSISLPTDQPTTAAPTQVASPTVQPTTPEPTTPVATTPEATTAQPTPAATSTSTSSTSTPAWLWLILALVLLAGIAFILIARASSKRSAAASQWRSQVTDVYARGSALHDAMASVEWPSGPGQDQGQAQARWVDIQRRADDLAQILYRMRETAPDEDNRMRVDDVLSALQSVRTAMDAERSQGGGTERNEYSRSRLYTFARSLRALHGDPEGSGLY